MLNGQLFPCISLPTPDPASVIARCLPSSVFVANPRDRRKSTAASSSGLPDGMRTFGRVATLRRSRYASAGTCSDLMFRPLYDSSPAILSNRGVGHNFPLSHGTGPGSFARDLHSEKLNG